MLAVAILAGLFAVFGVIGSISVAVVLGVIFLPILLAGPGRRLRAAAWVGSIYPLFLPCSLYATWFTAWLVLGHRPRSSLDDPKFISPLVDIPYAFTFLFGMSMPFSLFVSISLMLAYVAQGIERKRMSPWRGAALMFVPVATWLSVWAILGRGLLGTGYIIEWYMD
jgi:hypothetical protein